MSYECPVDGCDKELSKLQVMHFRHTHDCEPHEWVAENHGEEIAYLYHEEGLGAYDLADKMPVYITRNIIPKVIDTRNWEEAMSDFNPMKRERLRDWFTHNNPAKTPETQKKISEANSGDKHWTQQDDYSPEDHPMYGTTRDDLGGPDFLSEEGKEAIVASQTGRVKSEEERQKLSDALKGREPVPGSGYVDWYTLSEHIPGIEDDRQVQGRLELAVAEYLTETFGADAFDTQVPFNYTVDFTVPDHNLAIECKGRIWGDCVEKGREFMEEHDWYYIIIGQHEETRQIPCDLWIPSDGL